MCFCSDAKKKKKGVCGWGGGAANSEAEISDLLELHLLLKLVGIKFSDRHAVPIALFRDS